MGEVGEVTYSIRFSPSVGQTWDMLFKFPLLCSLSMLLK